MSNHYHLVLLVNEEALSDCTGNEICERLDNKSHHAESTDTIDGKPFVKFIGAQHQHQPQDINFTLIDSIELIDWTGRIIRATKRGGIPSQTPALLAILGLDNQT
jgi:hypothetical protein